MNRWTEDCVNIYTTCIAIARVICGSLCHYVSAYSTLYPVNTRVPTTYVPKQNLTFQNSRNGMHRHVRSSLRSVHKHTLYTHSRIITLRDGYPYKSLNTPMHSDTTQYMNSSFIGSKFSDMPIYDPV